MNWQGGGEARTWVCRDKSGKEDTIEKQKQ